MKKILIGCFERVLGAVSVDRSDQWVLEPQDTTKEELNDAVEVVYARLRRRRKALTRAQFVNLFFAKGGPPTAAYASSAWGKRTISTELQALLASFSPPDDPFLVELRRHDHDLLAQSTLLHQA